MRCLAERVGYRFSEPGLFELALTHRSAGAVNNERMEFFGDAVIGFLVAEALVGAHPDADEGKLTRLRARVVRRESLARIAREVGLGPALHLGASALKSGGRDLDSVLADAFEALIGAICLDGGLDAARHALAPMVEDSLERAARGDGRKDAKTRLQERLQARGEALPAYRVEAISGAEHERWFEVSCCYSATREPARGAGSSRRKAEQQAALSALEVLEHG